MPGMSVLSARHPDGQRIRVLATPATRATGEAVEASASASRLSGAVTDSPRQGAGRPATWAARPSARTSRAS